MLINISTGKVIKMFLLIGQKWFCGEIQAVIYNLGLIFWMVSEIGIFLLSERADKKDCQATVYDNMSIYGVIAANVISCLLALFCTQYLQIKLPSAVVFVGIILLYCGIALRVYSVWTLRKYFTVSVEIKTGHKLIRKGPYRYVRHPSYSGSILSLIGMQIGLRSPVGFVVSLILAFLAYNYRIHVEEDAMVGAFGTEYKNYKKATKRIIPFVF
jgi:protein-S-isoprenylcysteine O-methyltransferase Ste14